MTRTIKEKLENKKKELKEMALKQHFNHIQLGIIAKLYEGYLMALYEMEFINKAEYHNEYCNFIVSFSDMIKKEV